MTDHATTFVNNDTAALTPAGAPARKAYDADVLVRLLAEGRLSHRDIAEKVAVSASFVSQVSRGVRRHDVYLRVCNAVEAAHRRVERLVSDNMAALVEAHLKEALEGTGETARRCREFLIKTFAHRPDPAGRYADGAPDAVALKTTPDEQTLIKVVRGGPKAPTCDDLPKHLRTRLADLVPTEPFEQQMIEMALFVDKEILGCPETCDVDELPLNLCQKGEIKEREFVQAGRWIEFIKKYPKLGEAIRRTWFPPHPNTDQVSAPPTTTAV